MDAESAHPVAQGIPEPPPPVPRWAWILGAALVAVAALVGVLWWKDFCARGVRRLGPQDDCVGVTDRYSFPGSTSDLRSVMQRIEDENLRVERTGQAFLSIAYVVPLSFRETESGLADEYRHELQGAQIAQLQANRRRGRQPLIRLHVANTGEDSAQWQPVVARLGEMADSPEERLLAVVGLGESRATTQQTIQALTHYGIPVVAARLTADDLNGAALGTSTDGLVRVTPTNSDEAKAMVAHLESDAGKSLLTQDGEPKALVVQDTNPGDLYTQTLGQAFIREFARGGGTVIERIEEYDARNPGIANTFVQMLSNVCLQLPDVVYFAGRGRELVAFMEALPQRACLDLHINILTGDDTEDIVVELQRQLSEGEGGLRAGLDSDATLRYTSLAHPGAWPAMKEWFSPTAISYFQEGRDCSDCFQRLFPGEPLDDGAAIMGHDAVLTAVTAIQTVAGERRLDIDPIQRREVIGQFNRINNCSAVGGASGWISLDNDGNPERKAIPILELHADGPVAFVTLGSSRAAPFQPACQALASRRRTARAA